MLLSQKLNIVFGYRFTQTKKLLQQTPETIHFLGVKAINAFGNV